MSEEQRAHQGAELQRAVDMAQAECTLLTEQAKAAETEWKRAEAALKTVRGEHDRLREAAGRANRAEEVAQRGWQSAWGKLPAARNRIPAPFREATVLPADAAQAATNDAWRAPDAHPTPTLLKEMQVEVESLPTLETERTDWDGEKQEWKRAVGIQGERQHAWESARDALSEADHTDFATAADDRAVFDALTAERETLAGAETQLADLEKALRDLAVLKARRSALTDGIAKIAENHRIPVADAEARLETARVALAEADREQRDAEDLVKTLRERQQQRARLKGDLDCYTALRDRYGLLTELLVREKLQRELLRVAEGRILEHANGILGRFSGGILRLAPRPDDGSRGAGTALDFICHNYETGSESLLLKLLSGSQKFRVSVALALGIGKFLSGDEARRRSVIIDEGFGSLDPNGLRDMAEEMKNLGELLDRVIVVSHQNEFAEKFPDRYHIRLVNGSSHPERQVA